MQVEYLLNSGSISYSHFHSDGRGFICEADMFGLLFNTKQMPRFGMSVSPNPSVAKDHVV